MVGDRLRILHCYEPNLIGINFPSNGSDVMLANHIQEYFVSGFTVILPTLTTELNIPSSSATWPASAFSLVVASFLLIFGRLGDMYGGYPIYVAGLVWLTAWSLVAGFSTNQIMLCICRALQYV